ncbi:MAG: zinc-ribbon domain-containing protein [Dehalococcoidia bacterium]|nr:zinc-ribbon domain-containing protein [Dehalococcoidia bacterium]
MKCPHCGTMNMPVAKFCTECGIRLTSGRPHDD